MPYLALAIEQIAGFLTFGATFVALLYVWRPRGFVRFVYWMTFSVAVAVLLLMAAGSNASLWGAALFGPPRNDLRGDWFEQLNVANFWLLLFFFSVPFWRGRLRRR